MPRAGWALLAYVVDLLEVRQTGTKRGSKRATAPRVACAEVPNWSKDNVMRVKGMRGTWSVSEVSFLEHQWIPSASFWFKAFASAT